MLYFSPAKIISIVAVLLAAVILPMVIVTVVFAIRSD